MRSISMILALFLMEPGSGVAQTTCARVGSERWVVKTMAPIADDSVLRFDTAELVALPAPTDIQVPHDKMLDTRYPTDIAPGLHEGSLVRVRGYVRRIKTSPDDCDYHIEITPAPDSNDGMVIVEVPAPDASHVSDAALRQQVGEVRNWLKQALHLSREPSSSGAAIGGRVYLEFSGALFFDGPHAPNCSARGSRPGAATCWEIHPVTAVGFAPRPQQEARRADRDRAPRTVPEFPEATSFRAS